MRYFKQIILALLLVTATFTLPAAELFRSGERVVFLGDSITYAGKFIGILRGFAAAAEDTETFFFNAGIPGDTCTLAIARIEREIVPLKPDVVFVMFGMNDLEGWRYAKADGNQTVPIIRAQSVFKRKFSEMIGKLQAHHWRIVLLTPTPYDQYGTLPGTIWTDYNEKGLAKATAVIKEYSKKHDIACLDLFTPMTEYLKEHPEKHLCGKDRIHPEMQGHLMIARLIWNGVKSTPLPKIVDKSDFAKKLQPLMHEENLLREAAWMQEVAVRNGATPGDFESEDAAFAKDLAGRNGTGKQKYQTMIKHYQSIRLTLPERIEKFYAACSAIFKK